MSNPTILVAPIRGRPKSVTTDASDYGLGGVLLQLDNEDKWAPVSFASRALKKAKRNYASKERVCLAIVDYLRKWRHYLNGESFTGSTDHLSLKWRTSLKNPREELAR